MLLSESEPELEEESSRVCLKKLRMLDCLGGCLYLIVSGRTIAALRTSSNRWSRSISGYSTLICCESFCFGLC